MAVKGPLWLMGKCLEEERNRGPLTHLASKALDLGIRKRESTRGHVFQATGAVQQFLISYPQHKATIRASSPIHPFKPFSQILDDWRTFFRSHSGPFGGHNFGYNYDTLRGYLTGKYGGSRTGGGGGDNEFETVMRPLAAFIR